jgi:hypothetical protein
MAIFNTGMEIPHKSSVVREKPSENKHVSGAPMACAGEISVVLLRKKNDQKVVSQMWNINACTKGSVKYKEQEIITEFSTALSSWLEVYIKHDIGAQGFIWNPAGSLTREPHYCSPGVQTEATV